MKDFFDRMISESDDSPKETAGDDAQPSANGHPRARRAKLLFAHLRKLGKSPRSY